MKNFRPVNVVQVYICRDRRNLAFEGNFIIWRATYGNLRSSFFNYKACVEALYAVLGKKGLKSAFVFFWLWNVGQ